MSKKRHIEPVPHAYCPRCLTLRKVSHEFAGTHPADPSVPETKVSCKTCAAVIPAWMKEA